MELLKSELFLVTLTTLVYIACQKIYQKANSILLNPVLLSVVFLIAFLLFFEIDYLHYQQNTKIISFWLNPSVVALAIPLYLQMKRIKKDWKRIILATLSGAIIGIVSVVFIAKLFGASKAIILALAPKSVSTPIAINISETIGGIPPLTAGVVVVTGIFGAVLGETIIKLVKVKNPNAIGLAMGTASHALGTAKIATKGDEYSSYSAMGLAINGILTSILAPILLDWLGIYL
ncbi:MAG: LrgB family protein [Flavobacteriaceae bacterium]|nr:LrgB family protein [Flavobacteriaceae bacterium]